MAAPAGDSDAAAAREEPPAAAEGGAAGTRRVEDVEDAILELISANASGADRSKDAIQNIQAERRSLQAKKRKLTLELRNETRKRKRMLCKSSRLSTHDLVEVLHIHQNRIVAQSKANAR